MDKEKQGRKQNVTEGDGSVKVNKDERVSGSVGTGSKNPAGKKPTAAQGNKTPGSVQGVKPNAQGQADDAEKGLVGDIAGSVLTNVVSNAIGGNNQSSNNSLLGTVLGAAAGAAASGSGSSAKRSGGLGKLLRLVLIIVVLFLAFKMLKSCLGGGGYNPIEDSKPYWNDSVYVESEAESSKLPDIVVDGKPRSYYTKLNGKGNDTVTIMIYMCGADLESKYGLATADLNEICSATIADNVNIIVETGGASKWQNNIVSNRTTQRYKVVKGGVQKLQDLGSQKQMTDPNTLAEFIQFCSANFPANRNILIFWDHGGGSVSGYGYDENYTNRGTMTLDQISQALKNGGVKFDIVGYDACLMACLENAFACEPYADYLLASEESEPGYGWFYTTWITQLSQNTSTSTEALAKTIIDDYISHCAKEARGSDATLSLIDLAKLKGYVPAYFQAFANATSQLITGNNYSAVSNARGRAHEFAASSKIDQVDLIDFASRLNTVESQALVTALKKCIVYNKANISGAYGISVYFPYKRTSYVSTAANLYNKIGIDSAYTNCIRSMASAMSGGQIVSNGSGSALGSLTGNLFDSYGYSDSSSISSGTVSDLLGSFFGSGSGSSGALGDLLGGYSSSGLDNNYSYGANDNLYNSLMGSSQSGNYSYGSGSGASNSYGTYGSLFGSLLGGSSNQSSSSGADLTSALLSGLFGRDSSSRMIEMSDYYAENYLDAGRLVATEKGKGYVLHLNDEEWDLVTDCALNLFIDDGAGYVDLGIDNLYEFDKDGDLKLDFKGTWLAVNGQIVSYYFVSENEDTGEIIGYVPCLWNNKRANLVFSFSKSGKGSFLGVRFLYENETSMETKGYIAPDQKRIQSDDLSATSEDELILAKGSVIKFLCDYYAYDGTFESAYVLGSPLVYDGELKISDVKLKLDANQSALLTYRLTDIYNNYFWTESLEF